MSKMHRKEKADLNVRFICSLLRIIKTGFEPVTFSLEGSCSIH